MYMRSCFLCAMSTSLCRGGQCFNFMCGGRFGDVIISDLDTNSYLFLYLLDSVCVKSVYRNEKMRGYLLFVWLLTCLCAFVNVCDDETSKQ